MLLRDGLMVATVVLALASTTIFLRRVAAIGRVMRRARPVVRWDRSPARLWSVVVHVLGHRRMLRVTWSGVLHYFIFSGFVVLFIDIVETIGQVFMPGFSVGSVLAPFADVWVILVLVGVAMAVINRVVFRPERFEGSDERDAYIILGLITLIMFGIVLHEAAYPAVAARLFHVPDPDRRAHFLGYAVYRLGQHLGLTTPAFAGAGYAVGYLLDIGVVFGFLAYLPYSKHLHIFSAVPNIFFRNLRAPGELVAEPPADTIAVKGYPDFRWKDILDLFTCTECGRCQAVCPAHAAGQPLSPKMVILDLRDALVQRMTQGVWEAADPDQPLAGGVVSAEALWACTTCGACQEACPVFIEHVPKIVGLRAALLEEGTVDPGAQKVLVAWDRHGNSFGQPPRRRPQWAKDLDVPVKDARREAVDWLWFVGDFASYDPRLQELTRTVARLLHAAGVDFGILYDGEVNSGNDALRMGEYGLFETLAQKNLKALQQAHYERVFTTDPHSLNALKNEYRKFGYERPVVHYTEAFLELVEQGRLPVRPLGIRATYHDPCYLGRWNGIVEAPRALLRRLGVDLVEMPRHGTGSFCCGAGGGRVWMEEKGIRERPADQRIREALSLPGVTHFVVACPKDVAMFSASVVAVGAAERLRVSDIVELLAAAHAGTGAEVPAAAP